MDVENTSLYQTLGIDPSKQDVLSLSEKDITTAYRRAALKWHPDKNRNDPDAAMKFSRIFFAYETLSTSTKRKEYDDKIRATRARRQAIQQMDATRRKMRQNIQQRELQAAQQQQKQKQKQKDDNALSRVRKEIDRLRKEAFSTQQQQQQQDNVRGDGGNSKAKMKEKEHKKHSDHDDVHGFWASVPQFNDFMGKTKSTVTFEQFEQAVLEGRNPFPK